MSESEVQYGPHEWKSTRPSLSPNEPVLDGPAESRCQLCGAWITRPGEEPMDGKNEQPDKNLCGCNPIETDLRALLTVKEFQIATLRIKLEASETRVKQLTDSNEVARTNEFLRKELAKKEELFDSALLEIERIIKSFRDPA